MIGDSGRFKLEDGWLRRSGAVTAADIRGLASRGHIDKISITRGAALTANQAKAFSALKSVRQLWLWCDVTRAAMSHIVAIPGLQIVDVMSIEGRGRLAGFAHAKSLRELRANCFLREADLLEIASCRSLREIGAQHALLTDRALDALLALPRLESLDIEGTRFNDAMAARISRSRSLRALDIGGTAIGRAGLQDICRMKRLRSLDIWATRIVEADLDLLADMPNLEYLSIGHYDRDSRKTFEARTLLSRLQNIRSLKRIFLDGIALSKDHIAVLKRRYDARILP